MISTDVQTDKQMQCTMYKLLVDRFDSHFSVEGLPTKIHRDEIRMAYGCKGALYR
jgi:hypothetical protein